MARAIFAVGHMLPSFALLITASGIGLLLEEEPPTIAYWLPCVGLGIYLLGTRVFMVAKDGKLRIVKLVLLIVILQLGRLHDTLSPFEYVWLVTGLAVLCAAITTLEPEREPLEA
jgi:hypothetical protein